MTSRAQSVGAGLRAAVLGLLAGLLPTLAACQGAGGPAASPRPGNVVDIADGRRLNLRCSGRGTPTVILESGFGADSRAWPRVQAQVARTTRVCAYDRAGYGFSPPGPLPRDGAAIVRDLDSALTNARIEGPYVLVGHSAGGLYARLFAARRLGEVAGLVLVDATAERPGPAPPGAPDGLDGIRRRLQRCLAALDAAPGDAAAAERGGCVNGAMDPQARASALDPATWRNQLSELDELMSGTSDQVRRIGTLLEDVPAYVISASDTVNASRDTRYPTAPSIWLLRQQQMASRFRHASQQTVLSSHLIMKDRPDVIVAAVEEMVRAQRAGRPPAALLPSEGEEAPAEDATTWSGGGPPG